MAKNISVGIDIGSASIQSVISTWGRKEQGLRILGLGSAESVGVRKGRIVDVEAAAKSLGDSLRAAEKHAGVRIKSAILAAGGVGIESTRSKGSAVVTRANNEISEYDVGRALEVAQSNLDPLVNHEILHSLPLAFTIDGNLKTASPVGMKGTKLECHAMFITALAKDIRNLVKCAELAGVVVEDVVAAPLAASRAMLPKRHKDVGTILMDIGGSTCTLAVFEEGMPLSLEVLPIGSTNITHDLAIGFKTTLEEAEELKQSFEVRGAAAKKQLAEIISARLSDIFELTNKHLKKIERVALLPAGVVLTGGGAAMAEIDDFAKDYLELPAFVGQVVGANFPTSMQAGPWAVSIGLCLLAYDSVKGKPEPGFELTRKTGNIILRWVKSLLP